MVQLEPVTVQLDSRQLGQFCKNLVTQKTVHQLHQESAQNSSKSLILKFLISTHTTTAISWPPFLISQLFHTGHFKQGCTFFTARLFLSSFCYILQGLDDSC